MNHTTACLPLLALLLVLCASAASAQPGPAPEISDPPPAADSAPPTRGEVEEMRREMQEQRRLLAEQQREIERLRADFLNQARLIGELRAGAHEGAPQPPATEAAAQSPPAQTPGRPDAVAAQMARIETRLERVEGQSRQTSESLTRRFGTITFSGDLRMRYEGTFRQLSPLPNVDNPAVLGNELTPLHRGRIRARLAVRGTIGRRIDWGLRLATGDYSDAIASYQTFGDMYNRKPFGLDQAFISYRPSRIPGLQLQAGKFEVPWLHTEMTFDNDLNPEGVNQSYSRDFNTSALKNVTFVLWQLPFLERNASFVRDSSGALRIDRSGRDGRDLALYGAQVRARFAFTPRVGLTLSAADLHFDGTQFITPARFFGEEVELPVTVTLPSVGGAPAQTLTGLARVPRSQLVSGGGLGLSTASNNATNSDGSLSSGYNLIDLVGRLDLTASKRFPVALVMNYVVNTHARGVVTSGAVIRPNDERSGYWAEVLVGKVQERNDVLFGYTFTRIEKDAVLTPFNFSDFAQQSDIRAQRFHFSFAADARVILSATVNVTRRANGLAGPFGVNPVSSLDRSTVRLQLDSTFRF